MAGYDGWSMSNNARQAYEDGERPKSKWTKGDLLEEIDRAAKEDGISYDKKALSKISSETLRDEFLRKSSWHHTSSMYNQTDFYSLDDNAVEKLAKSGRINDLSEIDERTKAYNKASKEKLSKEETWEVEYLEWSGPRSRPRATTKTATGTIRGDWFYLPDGSKKSIKARGFRKVRPAISKPEKKAAPAAKKTVKKAAPKKAAGTVLFSKILPRKKAPAKKTMPKKTLVKKAVKNRKK